MSAKRAVATGFQLTDHAVHGVCLAREGAVVRLLGTVTIPVERDIDPVRLGGEPGRTAAAKALAAAGRNLATDLGSVSVGLGHGAYLLKMSSLLYPQPSGRRQARENMEQLDWELDQVLGEEALFFATAKAAVGTRGVAVAVRQAVLDLYARVFAEAGLSEPSFDIEAFALYNMAEAAGLLAAAPDAVLVTHDGVAAEVVVVRDGELEQVIRCSSSGESARELGECLRKHCHCPGTDEHPGTDEEGRKPDGCAGIWVAGIRARELCGMLGEEFGHPAQPMLWHQLMEVDEAPEDAPRLAVAAGLAVRRLDP